MAATDYPFGNDPGKIEGYEAFWNRTDVDRPLVGFSFVGWYPLAYFNVCKSWRVNDYITPEMLRPDEWLDDYEELLSEGEDIEDDMLRGACPIQVAFPCFLPAILGCKIRVLPGNVMGDVQRPLMEGGFGEKTGSLRIPGSGNTLEFLEGIGRSGGRTLSRQPRRRTWSLPICTPCCVGMNGSIY